MRCRLLPWSGMVPFSYLLECPKQEEELCYHISPGVEQISFGLLGWAECGSESSLIV